MNRDEERQIISEVISGNTDAFAALVSENQSRVYNLALRMTGNSEDAYDLSQDSFLKAFKSLKSFKGDSSFSVWLYRLTRNVCIDFLRREKRRIKGSITYIDDEGEEKEIEIPDVRGLPEKLIENKQLKEELNAALLQLSQEHREILILRDVNGLSYDEIAQILDISSGTVKSRISRARAAMIKILKSGNFCKEKSSDKAVRR